MSDNDTEQEKSFRERYAEELRKKRQQDTYSYGGDNELVEERVQVNQQEQKTPGRRGEKIKQEEINKEIVRRDMIKNKGIPRTLNGLEKK
jgi:pyrrolidone-carboxylate peptidase